MTEAQRIAEDLVQYEKDVLLGRVTEWGAAMGAAIETLRARGLLDSSGKRTRLGIEVAFTLTKRSTES